MSLQGCVSSDPYCSDFILGMIPIDLQLHRQILERTLLPGLYTCQSLAPFTQITTNGPSFCSSGSSALSACPTGHWASSPCHFSHRNITVPLLVCLTTVTLWRIGAISYSFDFLGTCHLKKVLFSEWVSPCHPCQVWKNIYFYHVLPKAS